MPTNHLQLACCMVHWKTQPCFLAGLFRRPADALTVLLHQLFPLLNIFLHVGALYGALHGGYVLVGAVVPRAAAAAAFGVVCSGA